MEFIINYLLGFVVLISVLVFVHELGHYLFAKWFGVKVESFSIGFGKELFGFTDKSGTRWKFCPIPFGGYVKMKGEMISESPDLTDKQSFESKNLWQKFLIVFAGPLFSLIFPIIVIFLIILFNGQTKYDTTIGKVAQDTPAYSVLQENDKILSVNNTKLEFFSDLQVLLQNNANKTIKIAVNRDNKVLNFDIKLSSTTINGKTIGLLGIQSSNNVLSKNYSPVDAAKVSWNIYVSVTKAIIIGLQKLFTLNLSLKDIGGPIKIAQIAGDSAKDGFSSWLFLMSLISINLAIMNLLPIPALDGGYLLLYLIQGLTRKKIGYKLQLKLISSGFYLLIVLMLAILLKDIIGLVTGTL